MATCHLIEIQPNAYNKYLPETAGVTLIYHPRRKADVKMLTSRQDSLQISVHIVRIWLVFTLALPWVLSSIHIQRFNVTYKMVAE